MFIVDLVVYSGPIAIGPGASRNSHRAARIPQLADELADANHEGWLSPAVWGPPQFQTATRRAGPAEIQKS
jgi:hypothetical protein